MGGDDLSVLCQGGREQEGGGGGVAVLRRPALIEQRFELPLELEGVGLVTLSGVLDRVDFVSTHQNKQGAAGEEQPQAVRDRGGGLRHLGKCTALRVIIR